MNKQLRYILYARKSTDSEDKQIQSIEDQKRELRKEIERRKIIITHTFEESQSAKKPGRSKYNEMMQLLKEGKADGILCWKLNRLSRNPIDGGEIQWLLQGNIIKSIITPGREYLPTDNVLMMAVELGMANQFIIDLRKDVIRGLRSKVEKGWKLGKAPLGYLNDRYGEKGKKQVLVDPERFHIVRKLWDLLLTGHYSVHQIANIANNDLGLRTLKGDTIHDSTLYNLFTKSFYYGDFEAFGEVYRGKHTPMITVREFDIVQAILGKKGKPRPKSKRLPYNGIIECGECGGMITTEEKIKTIKTKNEIAAYVYHRCSKRKKDKTCHQRRITHRKLTEQVRNYLDQITIPEEFIHWAVDILKKQKLIEETDRTSILRNQQKIYESHLQKIDGLLNTFISPENANRELVTDTEYKEKKAALNHEKRRLEEEIEKNKNCEDESMYLTEKTFKFAAYAKHEFDQGDYEVKTKILRCLGDKSIFKDGDLNIKFQKPFILIRDAINSEPLKGARLELETPCSIERKNSLFSAVFSDLSH